MPKILLHTCCAWCLLRTLVSLRSELPDFSQLEIHLLWFNPNIHPLLEYRRRLKALRVYLDRAPLPLTFIDDYGLESFCRMQNHDFSTPARCARCYESRLRKTAELARGKYDFFATTLMASLEQNHDLLKTVGEKVAAASGGVFLYRDCRAAEIPVKLGNGIYKQSYCGCVFSEFDRYRHTNLHLYSPPAATPN